MSSSFCVFLYRERERPEDRTLHVTGKERT